MERTSSRPGRSAPRCDGPLAVPRFYVEGPLEASRSVALPEEAAHHAVRVLRVREGEEITLFNGRGGEYAGRVAAIRKAEVSVALQEHRAVERESPLRMTLVQGVSSGERMEFTIRKAVELGVAEIRPVLAAGSVARPKGERAAARQAHWQRIAISACEQCGRNRIPVVHPLAPAPYRPEPGEASLKLLLSPRAGNALSASLPGMLASVCLAAGPEAGFDAAEEAGFLEAGFVPVQMGPRILRTETAALAALAALSALRGDI